MRSDKDVQKDGDDDYGDGDGGAKSDHHDSNSNGCIH